MIEFDGLDTVFSKQFDLKNRWDSKAPPIRRNFTLPINGNQQKRDVDMDVINLQQGLELQLQVECDDS